MPEQSASMLRRFRLQTRDFFRGTSVSVSDETQLSFLQKLIHFWALTVRGFVQNRCPVRASSLAYTTLLALVPLLAVAISISTGFLKTSDGQKKIEQAIDGLVVRIAPQLGLSRGDSADSDQKKVAENINHFIQNVSSTTLGVTATLALIFVGISLLSSIEGTFNDIWGVSRGRSWLSRVVLYWAVITLGPILLFLGMGLNLGPHFASTKSLLESAPFLGNFIYEFLPAVVLSFTFAAFFKFMPYAKVEWTAALTGGLTSGVLWHLNNKASVLYFGQVVRNKQIYGSLGLLPVFLIGIYFSWLILLFGAQAAFSFQNRRAFFHERLAEKLGQRVRESLAFRVMTLIARRFFTQERPPTVRELSETLDVPSSLVSRIVDPLIESRLLVEVSGREAAYVPGRPLENITFKNVIDSLRAGAALEPFDGRDGDSAVVRDAVRRVQHAEETASGSITLASLMPLLPGVTGQDSADSRLETL
jgi:membrane protein